MRKNVIVTGGNGVTGKWVVANLLARGHRELDHDQVPRAALPVLPGALRPQARRLIPIWQTQTRCSTPWPAPPCCAT